MMNEDAHVDESVELSADEGALDARDFVFDEADLPVWQRDGFKLSLEHDNAPVPMTRVFAAGKPVDGKPGTFKKHLLATVTTGEMRTHPLISTEEALRFALPKHGKLTKITVQFSKPIALPQDLDDLDRVMRMLPKGFGRKAKFGMGLQRSFWIIPEIVSDAPGVDEMVLCEGDEARVDGSKIRIGKQRFEALVKALDSVANRFKSRSLQERKMFIHNELLAQADARKFPKKERYLRPGEIYELVALGGHGQMSAADRRAVVDAVRGEAAQMAAKDPGPFYALKSTIELVALSDLARRIELMLAQRLSERRWQSFFEDHPFALTIAFPHPVVWLTGQAHVGGSTIRGTDGSIADFLLSNDFTGNMALVEIKTPGARLLEKKAYRNGIHAPHADLTRSMAQLLHQRDRLIRHFNSRKADDRELRDRHVSAVHCVLVIGSSTQVDDDDRKRSLELFRNSSKDVVVVTFDELLAKLHAILKVAAPSPEGEQAAPTLADGLAADGS